MKTIEYKTEDKAEWPRGEWDDEPDKMQWQDERTKLPCLIVRGPAGALCGYVGVPEGHVYYGASYDDPPVTAHGGLTFADKCDPSEDQAGAICHLTEVGDPDNVWWFGFDCAHHMDLMPKWLLEQPLISSGTYRNVAYVKDQCAALALQLLTTEREKT